MEKIGMKNDFSSFLVTTFQKLLFQNGWNLLSCCRSVFFITKNLNFLCGYICSNCRKRDCHLSYITKLTSKKKKKHWVNFEVLGPMF
jgi:hypothetical protein